MRKHILDDEQDTIIKGKFSVDEIFGQDLTYKNGKLRLKVRLKYFWYGLFDKRDEYRYRRQRAKRGYSDYDVWDFQMWFVRTLRPMLENINANLYSYPEEITFEEWKAIIGEMILLLRIMDWDDDVFIRERLGLGAEDCDSDTYNLIEEKRKKARARFMELFSKWFCDLRY